MISFLCRYIIAYRQGMLLMYLFSQCELSTSFSSVLKHSCLSLYYIPTTFCIVMTKGLGEKKSFEKRNNLHCWDGMKGKRIAYNNLFNVELAIHQMFFGAFLLCHDSFIFSPQSPQSTAAAGLYNNTRVCVLMKNRVRQV